MGEPGGRPRSTDRTARRVIAAARDDLDDGRLWKARDRLGGALIETPADQEVLELLGETFFRMGDLPRAGATWLLTARTGADVETAIDAFRERHGNDDGAMARAVPLKAPIEAYPAAVQARLRDLGARGPRARVAPIVITAHRGSIGGWVAGLTSVVAFLAVIALLVVGVLNVIDIVAGSDDAGPVRSALAWFVAIVGGLLLIALAAAVVARRARGRGDDPPATT